MITRKRSAGITLVEVMVVLAVLGILAALAGPSFADLLNRRRVQAVAEQISTDLAYARAETGLRPQRVTVFFRADSSQSCYTLGYFGATGSCDCTRSGRSCNGTTTELKTARVPAKAGVSFSSFSGGWTELDAGRISFEPPQMTASQPDFSVTVNGLRGVQLKVEVNAMGRVRTCSPNGTFSGVPACS